MKKYLYIFLGFYLTACGANIFSASASKTSDESLYEDALKLIDDADFDGAIAKILLMTTANQNTEEVQRSLAGAYAGKCGLIFLDMMEGLSSGTGTPFNIFMSGFTSITVTPASCYTSQTTLETKFGATAAARDNSDVNMFMAVLGMAKIGTYLREKADADQDGVVDAAFNACNAGSISDAEVKQVGTGLGMVIDNFTAVAAAVSGGSGALDAIANLQAACALMPSNPCTITDPNSASWDATRIKAIRSIIKSTSYGIQSCADAGIVTCCP